MVAKLNVLPPPPKTLLLPNMFLPFPLPLTVAGKLKGDCVVVELPPKDKFAKGDELGFDEREDGMDSRFSSFSSAVAVLLWVAANENVVLTFVLEVVLVKLMLANGFDVDADGATLFCEELPFFFDRKMLALRSNIVGSLVGSLIDSVAFSKSL